MSKDFIKINNNLEEYAFTNKPIEFKQSRYKCGKHGDIGNHTVKFTLPNWVKRDFCLYCYQEMVMKYCCEAQEGE